jgi:hypothetical protein
MDDKRFRPVAIADDDSRTLKSIKPKALRKMGQNELVPGRYYLPDTTLKSFDRQGYRFFTNAIDVWPRLEYTGDPTLLIYDWPFTRPGFNFGTGASPTAKAQLDGSRFRIMPWTVILLVFSILTGLVFGHLFIGLLFGSSSEQSQSLGVVGYIFTSLLSVFMLMYAGLILYRSMMQKRLVQAFVKKQALLAEY